MYKQIFTKNHIERMKKADIDEPFKKHFLSYETTR